MEGQEVVPGDGALGHVGLPVTGLIGVLGVPGLQIGQELRQGDLGLTEDEVMGFRVQVRAGGGVRAAADHRLPKGAETLDEAQVVGLLRDHAAEEDQIGPFNVLGIEFLGVRVDETAFPR
jgi:hypothetical protein